MFTVRPEFLGEPHDAEFLAMVPPELEVIRTSAIPQSLTRAFRFGDLGLRSFFPILGALLDYSRRRGVDAVLIPGPP